MTFRVGDTVTVNKANINHSMKHIEPFDVGEVVTIYEISGLVNRRSFRLHYVRHDDGRIGVYYEKELLAQLQYSPSQEGDRDDDI